MRSMFVVLAALSLGACSCLNPPPKLGTTATLDEALAKGTLRCERKGKDPSIASEPAEKGAPDCRNIPITVLQVGGSCKTVIPYGVLSVDGRKGKTDVIWTLIAPAGYKFSDVKIAPDSVESRKPRDDVWTQPEVSKDGLTFTWRLKQKAPDANFTHDIFVVDNAGKTCVQVDPVIHNDAN